MSLVLCVEDDEDNVYMLHRRLSRVGFDVKVATNGAEAVEWAKNLLPDIIVMDLNMPKLNGWEATRQLKSQPETKHIPVIVLSGNFSEAHREKAFAAGCDDFEAKPADFERLVGKIQKFLGSGAKQ
jgi:two-component system cell cycle response regulator DivK